MAQRFKASLEDPALRAILGLTSPDEPCITLGAFIDEASGDIIEAARVASAAGLTCFSGRSCIYGQPTHFEELNVVQLRALLDHVRGATGMEMREFGTRLGKVNLQPDTDELRVRGEAMSETKYFAYVKRTLELVAEVMPDGFRRARVFDFYPPAGRQLESMDPLGNRICALIGRTLSIAKSLGVMLLFEPEKGLSGCSAARMHSFAEQLPGYLVNIDIGNFDSMGFGDEGAAEQATLLLPVTGPSMHLKAYLGEPDERPEELISRFGPFHLDEAHLQFMPALARELPRIERTYGLEHGGFICYLEPHFLKGGQFGGYTGVPGLGIAARSAQALCYLTGIGVKLRQYTDIRPDNCALVESC